MAKNDDPKVFADGNARWDGGMDASREPEEIGLTQFTRGCNVMLSRTEPGIGPRGGLHHQIIDWGGSDFAKRRFRFGHIQGEGYYKDSQGVVLVCSKAGWLFEFRQINNRVVQGRLLNKDDRNNRERTKTWIPRVPGGCIANDGESLPFTIQEGSIRRTDPSAGEIGVGRMGVFLQNRFFYVTPDEKHILASTYENPISLEEAYLTNIWGFNVAESTDRLTAIGRQKILLRDVESAALAWSTEGSLYAVDVRGNRANWGVAENDNYIGHVVQSVPGVGATSSFSFESFNTNLFFRSADYGVCSLRQSQFQFTNDDDFVNQSPEIAIWTEHDTEWMLDQCYTRAHKGRLYTTVAPALSHDGFVYWNGMVVFNPAPEYANQQDRRPRRFEGLVTGVRPWAITATRDNYERSTLWVWSYDADGENRLYKMDDDSDYDINHHGQRVEIEGWIETRAFTHGYANELKIPTLRRYSLSRLPRTIRMDMFSRLEALGPWQEWVSKVHLVKGVETGPGRALKPVTGGPQVRRSVILPSEPDGACDNPDGRGGPTYHSRQDRIEFKGPMHLKHWIRKGTIHPDRADVSRDETIAEMYQYGRRKDFGYLISNAKPEVALI